MAIGRDVYYDSSLQIAKLDMIPVRGNNVLSKDAMTAEQKFISWLVSNYLCKVNFRTAANLLPLDAGALTNPAFFADRTKLLGFDFKAMVAREQPRALSAFLSLFEMLETTVLSDGRTWLLNGDAPTALDIETAWQIVWLDMINALPAAHFSEKQFPNVRKWIATFNRVVKEAEAAAGRVPKVSGSEAQSILLAGKYVEAEGGVVDSDPFISQLGLKKGDAVTIWPNDAADATRKDSGRLIAANRDEIVIAVGSGDALLHVHAPIKGFHVKKSEAGKL